MTEETTELVKTDDKKLEPKDKVDFATKASNLLKDILSKRKRIIINGKEYVDFEGYQTIASFYGYSVGTEWTRPIVVDNKIIGYEAKAIVKNEKGNIVSSAESSCSRDESTWSERADFQLRSMAQTRACVKSLRNVFAWVMVLAGYQPTPSEEIMGDETSKENVSPNKLVCSRKGCGRKVSPKVADFSSKEFGKILCMECQKLAREGKLEPLDADYDVPEIQDIKDVGI